MVGREIRGELSADDTARLATGSNVDPQALQSYLQGRFLWNRRDSSDLLQAAGWFEDAIRRDPGLRFGVNVAGGQVTHPAVAEGVGMEYVAVEEALGLETLKPASTGGTE